MALINIGFYTSVFQSHRQNDNVAGRALFVGTTRVFNFAQIRLKGRGVCPPVYIDIRVGGLSSLDLTEEDKDGFTSFCSSTTDVYHFSRTCWYAYKNGRIVEIDLNQQMYKSYDD